MLSEISSVQFSSVTQSCPTMGRQGMKLLRPWRNTGFLSDPCRLHVECLFVTGGDSSGRCSLSWRLSRLLLFQHLELLKGCGGASAGLSSPTGDLDSEHPRLLM